MKHNESFNSSGEDSEQEQSGLDKFLGKIKHIKSFLSEKLGLKGKELDKAADEALVDAAREAIEEADADGERTEEEEGAIKEAVSTVLVQGAMEEAGFSEAHDGGNPITDFDPSGNSSEVVDSIASLHDDEVLLPDGREVAEVAVDVIEQAKWDRMVKVEGQQGSNEGGWYEDPETGDRYYVKFYENPDQGRVEFIANSIYAKLGIKTVRSEIIHMDGREAVASRAVEGITQEGMGWGEVRDTLAGSDEVQDGFVADCFLNNWDVVGLEYDNIVRTKDGFYRIDNGGSMIFRARGKFKDFPPDSIKELDDLRTHLDWPSGQVFHGITDEEIRRQARHLVENLTPEDIEALVDESGIEGEARDQVLQGLLGRREFLKQLCGYDEEGEDFLAESGDAGSGESGLDSNESGEKLAETRVGKLIQSLLEKEMETSYEEPVAPRSEIICDHGHVEGQRIEMIDDREANVLRMKLKLRPGMSPLMEPLEKMISTGQFPQMPLSETLSGTPINSDHELRFNGTKADIYSGGRREDSVDLCSSFSFERNGVVVHIANPAYRNDGGVIGYHGDAINLVRSAIGLIEIDAPRDMDPDEISRTLDEIFEKDFGMQDTLGEVSHDSEDSYKRARYAWSRKSRPEFLSEIDEVEAGGMRMETVFPGYSTYVQEGRHQELFRIGGEDAEHTPRAYHVMSLTLSGNAAARVIGRTLERGLLCTTERFSRGVLDRGMSSLEDLETGGSDNIFARLGYTQRFLGNADDYQAIVVFKPEVFDRMDYFAQNSDTWGSTQEEKFSGRKTPAEMFDLLRKGQLWDTNELMFRTGVGPQSIEYITVSTGELREKVISDLHSMGVTEIHGRPVEELIRARFETSPNATIVDHGATGTPIPPLPSSIGAPDAGYAGDTWGIQDSAADDSAWEGGNSAQESAEGSVQESAEGSAWSSGWDWLDDWGLEPSPEPPEPDTGFEQKPQPTPEELHEQLLAVINGGVDYGPVEELIDLCGDSVDEFDTLISGLIAKGDGDKLKSMFIEYFSKMPDAIAMIARDGIDSLELEDDKKMCQILIDKLGIDFGEIHKTITGEEI